jgi:hypothetical protein
MWGCLKFTYEALNWTAQIRITLNQIMQIQTKACIIKSFEVCALLRYCTVQSSNSALTFRVNLSVQVSRVRKSKRENRALEKFTDKIFFFGTLSIIWFLKDPKCVGSWLWLHFQANMHLTWWTPFIEFFSITGNPRNSNLFRYVTENRSSPREVTGKWQSKIQKWTKGLKNKTWTNPQIKKPNRGHEPRLIRPQTFNK